MNEPTLENLEKYGLSDVKQETSFFKKYLWIVVIILILLTTVGLSLYFYFVQNKSKDSTDSKCKNLTNNKPTDEEHIYYEKPIIS